MVIRRITRLGKQNKKRLLEFASKEADQSFNRIEELRAYLGLDTNEEAWEFTREQYNDYVPVERERLRDLDVASNQVEDQLTHLLNIGDVDEVVLNMNDYRPKFTLEEILNRIVLAVINDEQQGNFYTIQIGNNHYTLNDDVRSRLIKLVKDNLILEEEFGSDGIILQEIEDAEQITIRRWKQTNEYETPDGAFFKYKNITDMDFSRYGIFDKHCDWERVGKRKEGEKDKMKPISKYIDNCLIYALKEYCKTNDSLKLELVEEVKCYVKNLKVPMNVLPKIADVIQHRIRVNNIDYEDKYNVYGKKYENEISLGLIDSHYFINDTTNYTSYAIENYNDIKHIENFNHIYRARVKNGKSYYEKNKDRCISSFQLVKLLLENKDKLLKKLTTQEKQLAHSQFYNSVEEDFTNLSYNVKQCIKKVENETGAKSKMVKIYTPIFFDFETNTNEGNHIPYLCCCYFELNGKVFRKKFIGYDCGNQLLDFIPNNSMLVAHNASYDYRFVIRHLKDVSEISKGNKLVSCNAKYDGKDLKVKDSYNLIHMKLNDFNSNLELGEEMRKEVISHKLYTTENIEKRFIDIDYALSFLKTDEEKEQFLYNINEWNLLGENNTFDCLEYSANYCLKDCEILAKGYTKFRSMVYDSVKMNIDNILTIPSLSHNYFIREGCYEGVNQIGGIPQKFIQKTIVGGRCMTNSNLMILCYEILNDFDAVSLYPSAMAVMGFLLGIPKALMKRELCYEWLKERDGYFIEIEITDIGIHREFPLMSYIDDNGVRKWTNDMIGKKMYVNKITLEDLIEFQNIKFNIIRGYYFNEGKNNMIQKVIKYLFNERLDWKKKQNPTEQVFKLIMNSGYGKSIMKEIETENHFFNDKTSFQKYLSKNYNYINEYTEYGNGKYKVKKIKPFNQHFNLAHIGSEILSMSKRIMNRVMCLAEDVGLKILYTDTDSIHIKDSDIPYLKNAYSKKYNKTLIGKELGQFHTDFTIHKEKCENIVSIKSIFLGKKAYVDYLKGKSISTGKNVYEYHIRMKGVNEKSVYVYADENEMLNDIWKVYKKMFNSDEIEFDLMKGGCCNFKYDKSYNIKTDPLFKRMVCFRGNKIIMENGEVKKYSKNKDGKVFKIRQIKK